MTSNARASVKTMQEHRQPIKLEGKKVFSVLLASFVCLALHGCVIPRLNSADKVNTKSNFVGDVNTMHAHMKAADVAYDKGSWEEAIVHYENILIAIPTDPYAWFRLGNVYAKIGKINQAIHAYETSLTHDSNQFKPWFNLSTAHLLGAKIATLESLKSIGASGPTRAMVLSRLETLNLLLR